MNFIKIAECEIFVQFLLRERLVLRFGFKSKSNFDKVRDLKTLQMPIFKGKHFQKINDLW